MFLKELCQISGVSGDEERVADFIIDKIKPYVDDITVDIMGNVIAYIKGESSSKKVMIAAHMDEVGFIVSSMTDDGYLKFKTVGGYDERILPGKRVLVGNDKIPGVIGIKAIHLQSKDERNSVANEKKLVIDIGAKSKNEAEEYIRLGDYASFSDVYEEIGDERILSKALDDRVGCDVMISLAKEKYFYDTYLCFTVQEEVGTRGAKVVSERIKPDIAIILEATICSDVSGASPNLEITTMGGGAALSILDRGSYSDVGLTKHLFNFAKEKNIDVQYKRTNSGGNDARAIQIAGNGVKTAAVSVPCRYLHSPAGIISKKDYYSVKNLLAEFLRNIREFI